MFSALISQYIKQREFEKVQKLIHLVDPSNDYSVKTNLQHLTNKKSFFFFFKKNDTSKHTTKRET